MFPEEILDELHRVSGSFAIFSGILLAFQRFLGVSVLDLDILRLDDRRLRYLRRSRVSATNRFGHSKQILGLLRSVC